MSWKAASFVIADGHSLLYVTIEQEYGKKDRKPNYEKTTKLCRYHKGSTDPDRCGSDHCGSSLFLSGAEPYVCKQYLRSWYRAIKLCTVTIVGITMILNVVLLIIGFFTCGREFGVKTVYTSMFCRFSRII